MPTEKEITHLLNRSKDGDKEAADLLFPLVYGELRKLASAAMRRERPDHTLQATALVNEAYLRMLGSEGLSFENRTQFFGFCAHVMRNVLVDHAKSRRRAKRGGGVHFVELDEALHAAGEQGDATLLAVDDALTALARIDPQQARIVELKYFGGLTIPEMAELLGVSAATVKREWALARSWLYREINQEGRA